jgi:hypothetical protein
MKSSTKPPATKGIFRFLDRMDFMKNKNVIKALLGTILYDATFVVATVNMIVNGMIKSGTLMFAYLALRKIIRIASDIPVAGIIDKKITIKQSMIIALFLKTLFVLSVALQNTYILFAGIVCEGISLSFFRGKVSIFHYRILKQIGKEGSYSLLNTSYTFLIYIFTIINSWIGIYLLHKHSVLTSSLATAALLMMAVTLVSSVTLDFQKENQIKKRPSLIQMIVAQNTHITRNTIFLGILLGLCALGWELNTLNQFMTFKITNNSRYASIIFQYNSIAMMIGSFLAIILHNKNVGVSSSIFIFVLATNAILPHFVSTEHVPFIFLTYSLFFNIHENLLKTHIINTTPQESHTLAVSISTTATAILTITLQYIFMIFGNQRNPVMVNSVIFGTLTIIATFSTLMSTTNVKNNLDKSRQ